MGICNSIINYSLFERYVLEADTIHVSNSIKIFYDVQFKKDITLSSIEKISSNQIYTYLVVDETNRTAILLSGRTQYSLYMDKENIENKDSNYELLKWKNKIIFDLPIFSSCINVLLNDSNIHSTYRLITLKLQERHKLLTQ